MQPPASDSDASSVESVGRLTSEGPLGKNQRTYIRRQPERTVLHQVVQGYLETFLQETRTRGDGQGLPHFVERELREFLSCGSLPRGFARFRCTGCGHELLVAFSCKGRGFCPSCCGRRMAELAAHLVDDVLGGLPVRQWVLTLPYRLRYALAWDHDLCRKVLGVFIRALLSFERRRARRRGVDDGRGGAVTAIQRVGSALNINVHFHAIAVQGVFMEQADGSTRFGPAPAPTDREVTRLLAVIRRRIVRLVRHHGIDLEDPSLESEGGDQLLMENPVLAGIQGASVVGRVVTGPRAGSPVRRIGGHRSARVIPSGGSLHAHLEGFDLHAGVAVPAGDRGRLEHLCRYVLRPPLAQNAIELSADGKVLLHLRRPWHDGTRVICFEPSELLERLAAMIPKPRVNLLLYHGVFAPHARRRPGAVAHAQSPDSVAAPVQPVPLPDDASGQRPESGRGGRRRRKHFGWADLLRRTFAIDVLACPGCGGRLKFIATIDQGAVIEKILKHLGLSTAAPRAAPARELNWLPGFQPGDFGVHPVID